MIYHRLCSYWSSWQPPAPCKAVIQSTMRQHLYWVDLYNSLWGCATFRLHNILQQLLLCHLLEGSIDLVPSTSSFCMQNVAFKISVYESSFCSNYFAVTLHDSKISFVLCHLSAYHRLSSERVLWKFPEDRWTLTVFVHKTQHAFHIAVQLQWMLDGVRWGWKDILGVLNMLWHKFELNKPMFELASSVRFTEYVRAIFKSLPPNIYISTSASMFDNT